MNIKFNKHNVVNKDNGEKARVFYSVDNRIDKRECVTIYEKDYDRNLKKVFASGVINDTDTSTDYFENNRVVLFADHPLYKAARQRAEQK